MVIVVLLAIAMDPGYKYENSYIIEICVVVLLLPICNPGSQVKPLWPGLGNNFTFIKNQQETGHCVSAQLAQSSIAAYSPLTYFTVNTGDASDQCVA